MQREESFDSFYKATRRPVLLQAFALTGDLQAAQAAVRDSYVAAWHHWRKVERYEDPESWVRPHAWQLAQRRHAGRIWHRNKGLSPAHVAVLEGLAKLTSAQRRVLLLIQLADVPLPLAARELGVTQQVAERHLQTGTANLAAHLDTDTVSLRAILLGLDDALNSATLPRPSIIRRAGQKRRQAHTLVAVVAATALAIATGAVAYQPADSRTAAAGIRMVRPQVEAPVPDPDALGLPTADNLLDQDQIQRLGMKQRWKVRATHNNTSGDGINTICQQSRFADPEGLSAIVRTFKARGKVTRTAVQTVEVSASVEQARRGFDTTVGWYAGCREARLQLLQAYKVGNIGAEARMLMLRVWDKPVTTYSVAVARIGAVTTATVGKTVGGAPPPPGQVTQSLADAVSMLCARSGSRGCAKEPSVRVVPPPKSGEVPGLLAVADLPPAGTIQRPWVGIQTKGHPALTKCDSASFAKAGARRKRTRTYVIPEAKVPVRFGLTASYGVFPDARRARRFLGEVRSRIASCEDRDLATSVTDARQGRVARSGAEWSAWELVTETSESTSIRFRLGFVRFGRKVAQVTFVSAPRGDIAPARFDALLVRAGDRLREIG